MKFTKNLLTSTLFITLATSTPLRFPTLSLTHRTTDTVSTQEFPEIHTITDRDSLATVPTTDGKGKGKDYGAGAKCYRDADGNECGFKCHRAVETDGKGGKGGKKCYRDVTPGVAGLATDGWGAGCGLCYRDVDAGTAKVDTADDHDDDGDDDDNTAGTAGKKCYRDTDTATSADGNWGGNGGGCGGKCCGKDCGKDCGKGNGGGKNVIAKYGQCGGANWNGAGYCESGSYCKYQNEWYSQCV